MPYAVEVDPSARIAYLRGSGNTAPDEGHAVLIELAAHPDFEPGFALVCDMRGMDFEPTAETMMQGLENVVRFREVLSGRIAFVSPPALETPAELSAALYGAHGLDARSFSDLDAAVRWAKGGTAREANA